MWPTVDGGPEAYGFALGVRADVLQHGHCVDRNGVV